MGEEAAANAAKTSLAGDLVSDHLLLVKVFDMWRELRPGAQREFCRNNFLSSTTLQYIASVREDLKRAVAEFGLEGYSASSDGGAAAGITDRQRAHLVEAVLCGGLHPARVMQTKREPELFVSRDSTLPASFHPGCLASRKFGQAVRHAHFAVYFGLQRTTKLFVYDITPVPVLSMVLFAATAEQVTPSLLRLNGMPRHMVQFPSVEQCERLMRLRTLVRQDFLPRVMGHATRPADRAALRALLQLLANGDSALVAEPDSDDDAVGGVETAGDDGAPSRYVGEVRGHGQRRRHDAEAHEVAGAIAPAPPSDDTPFCHVCRRQWPSHMPRDCPVKSKPSLFRKRPVF